MVLMNTVAVVVVVHRSVPMNMVMANIDQNLHARSRIADENVDYRNVNCRRPSPMRGCHADIAALHVQCYVYGIVLGPAVVAAAEPKIQIN